MNAREIARTGWATYRSWPLWGQVLIGSLIVIVFVGAIGGRAEEGTRVEVAGDAEHAPPTTEVDVDESTTTETTTTTTGGGESPEGATRTGPAETAAQPVSDEVDRSEATSADVDRLRSLTVAREASRDGYDRALFPHWDDEDGDGCDTRCEVLSAQRQPDGSWFSEWDGATETDASLVHIDHIVSLAEAWDSGANTWSEAVRDEFADVRSNLIGVTAASNLRKSDKDAAEWFPSRHEANCFWARTVVHVKSAWDLAVDPAERDALENLLATCTGSSSSTEVAATPTTAAPTTTSAPAPSGCPNGERYTTADGSCIDDHDADGNGDVNCGEVPSEAKPVRVHDPSDDPHGLDGDGDGVGCQN